MARKSTGLQLQCNGQHLARLQGPDVQVLLHFFELGSSLPLPCSRSMRCGRNKTLSARASLPLDDGGGALLEFVAKRLRGLFSIGRNGQN